MLCNTVEDPFSNGFQSMTSSCKPFYEEGNHVIKPGWSGASSSVSNTFTNNEAFDMVFRSV